MKSARETKRIIKANQAYARNPLFQRINAAARAIALAHKQDPSGVYVVCVEDHPLDRLSAARSSTPATPA